MKEGGSGPCGVVLDVDPNNRGEGQTPGRNPPFTAPFPTRKASVRGRKGAPRGREPIPQVLIHLRMVHQVEVRKAPEMAAVVDLERDCAAAAAARGARQTDQQVAERVRDRVTLRPGQGGADEVVG